MNKLFGMTTMIFLTLFYNNSILGMKCKRNAITISSTPTIDDILGQEDVGKYLANTLPTEDRADLRLVCKKWASKDLEWNTIANWIFMPDGVEKEHDRVIKKNGKIDFPNKKAIFFLCAAHNDFEAITWLLSHEKAINSDLKIQGNGKIDSREISYKCEISAPMLAIHNKKYDLAKLLFTTHNKYRDKNWKTCYKEVVLPTDLQKCLFPSHNQDFSFLFYITAVWSDNAEELKKLYSQKTPTSLGQTILVAESYKYNSFNCFDIIISNKIGKEVIKNNLPYVTPMLANNAEITEIMVKEKAICITTIGSLLNEYSRKNDKKSELIYILLDTIYNKNR